MKRIIALALGAFLVSALPAMAATTKPLNIRPKMAQSKLPPPWPTNTTKPVVAPQSAQLTQAQVNANPLILLQKFSLADLQNAWNDAMRIDATCTSGTATNSNSLVLTGCSSTPHVGSTLASSGGTGSLTAPITITAVGTFANGAGSVTMSSVQTVTSAVVTATYSSPPPDTTSAMCYSELIVLLNSPINNPFPTSPGLFEALQKARDAQWALSNLQSPTGPLAALNTACAPLVLSVQSTLIALGIATGAVVGTQGLAIPALPGLAGLLPALGGL